MCGIVGYVGKKNAIKVIISGLETLEYRGYDSAGIAYRNVNNELKIIKETGKIVNLKEKLDFNEESHLGIGHTRWATHGEPNKVNSHPHKVGDITLVHNGIIENYESLKKCELLSGYSFESETDTEVACALIDALYKKEKDMLKALKEAQKILVGSYAFGVLVNGDNRLYAMRKDSPLIVGIGNDENFIASDVPAILAYTNRYYLLDNNDIAVIDDKNVVVYADGKEKRWKNKSLSMILKPL